MLSRNLGWLPLRLLREYTACVLRRLKMWPIFPSGSEQSKQADRQKFLHLGSPRETIFKRDKKHEGWWGRQIQRKKSFSSWYLRRQLALQCLTPGICIVQGFISVFGGKHSLTLVFIQMQQLSARATKLFVQQKRLGGDLQHNKVRRISA